jgi:hypothetical protein
MLSFHIYCMLFLFSNRTIYNLISTFVQFILPVLVVFIVYLTIFIRLKHRPQVRKYYQSPHAEDRN